MEAVSSFPATVLAEDLTTPVPWITHIPLYPFTNTTLHVTHPDVPREPHEYLMSPLISLLLNIR